MWSGGVRRQMREKKQQAGLQAHQSARAAEGASGGGRKSEVFNHAEPHI